VRKDCTTSAAPHPGRGWRDSQELDIFLTNSLKWVATFEAPIFVERGLWCWLCDVTGAGTLSPYLLISRELLHPIDPAGWNNVPTKPCLIFKPTRDSLDDKHAVVVHVVIVLGLVVVHSKSLDPWLLVNSIESSRNEDISDCGISISRTVSRR
jgi:hypothetical protein